MKPQFVETSNYRRFPDGAFDVVSLVGAEASSLGNGVSIYAQTWQTSRFLTGALT